ncbi:unnamed protein product, partial (macronuclear) [Paramecium tetraurelia]
MIKHFSQIISVCQIVVLSIMIYQIGNASILVQAIFMLHLVMNLLKKILNQLNSVPQPAYIISFNIKANVLIFNQKNLTVYRILITDYAANARKHVKHVLIPVRLLVVNVIQDFIYIILLALPSVLMIFPIKIHLIIYALLLAQNIKKMDIALLVVQIIITDMMLRNNVMNQVVQKELITKFLHVIAMPVLLGVLLVRMDHQIHVTHVKKDIFCKVHQHVLMTVMQIQILFKIGLMGNVINSVQLGLTCKLYLVGLQHVKQ